MLTPIPFHDGYLIDKKAQEVYSVKPRNGYPTKKIILPRKLRKHKWGIIRKNGSDARYWTVDLCFNGKLVHKKLAYLMLVTFVSPRPKGMWVCHGIRGQFDDALDNIYWGTPKRNAQDRFRDETDNCGEKHNKHKLSDSQVRIIRHVYKRYDKNGLSGNGLANMFGISNVHLLNIVYRKKWKHVI